MTLLMNFCLTYSDDKKMQDFVSKEYKKQLFAESKEDVSSLLERNN